MVHLETLFCRQIVTKILVVFTGLFFVFITNTFADESRDDCFICGMWIDQYMHTRHIVTEKEDTHEVKFCSITCTAKYLKNKKAIIKNIKVANFLTTELIDTEKAYYLVGSDVPGVMSYISNIAFSSKEDAAKFQKEHGGEITSFREALAIK